jgi:hypothetical protein
VADKLQHDATNSTAEASELTVQLLMLQTVQQKLPKNLLVINSDTRHLCAVALYVQAMSSGKQTWD